MSWSTVSKAALKSIKSEPLNSQDLSCRHCAILRRLMSVPSFPMNPVCALLIFWAQCFLSFPMMCSSKNFLTGDRTVIGLMSLIVGVFGCTLFSRTSLPVICFLKVSLEFMKETAYSSRILRKRFHFGNLVSTKTKSDTQSTETALFFVELWSPKFQ